MAWPNLRTSRRLYVVDDTVSRSYLRENLVTWLVRLLRWMSIRCQGRYVPWWEIITAAVPKVLHIVQDI